MVEAYVVAVWVMPGPDVFEGRLPDFAREVQSLVISKLRHRVA